MATQAVSMPGPIASLKIDAQDQAQSPWKMALRRFRQNRLAVAGVFVVLAFAFVALFADFISPFNLEDTTICSGPVAASACTAKGDTYLLAPPGTVDATSGHTDILGTDNLGRDLLTRIYYGARVALAVGIIAEAVSFAIGVPIGLIAGFFGGWVDNVLMRFTDIMYAFPDLLFVIIVVTAFGRSMWTIFIALGLVGWVTMARVVRGQVFQVKQMDYVMGARSIGVRSLGLMARHILPNVTGSIIVLITLGIPGLIIAESTLTFLGLGIDPSTPTWGSILTQAAEAIISHPSYVLFPALALAILTLSFTFIGDGVSDMLDPRRK
ncbi:MAG: ABC transporter permease [Aggregatilineales bacterium]